MSKTVSIRSAYKSSSPRSPAGSKSKRAAPVRPVLATSLPFGSPKQDDLVSSRICKDLCNECASPARGPGEYFCRECLVRSERTVEVARPFDAWSYRVRQIRPALPGISAFVGERVGLYGERRGSELICSGVDAFEQAKALVLEKYKRNGGCF
jgi:hypothetical protein